ncbi:Zinc finger, DHHC-type containing 24 [Cichlidogyrus casuarinus]|uniref:Palmitoyltransferase n=1 Tax=Cichlidogyrus casuarinus TaxID=1844966 RepID=A0ABD2Q0C2_9PLAT
MLNLLLFLKTETGFGKQFLADKETESWTFCSVCQCNRPLRAHHCELCSKCVLKRDHHCSFLNKCVGHHNHRYFLCLNLFLSFALFLFFCLHVNMILQNITSVERSRRALAAACDLQLSAKTSTENEKASSEYLKTAQYDFDMGYKNNLEQVLGKNYILAALFALYPSPPTADGYTFPFTLSQKFK